WDTASTQELRRESTGQQLCADGVLLLHDDAMVAACDDATLRRWDGRGPPRVLPTGIWLRFLAISSDGKTLAGGHSFGRLATVDLASWTITAQKTLHSHHIYAVQLTPDDRLVTASLDNHVRIWRLPKLDLDLDVPDRTDDGVLSAALSPDG